MWPNNPCPFRSSLERAVCSLLGFFRSRGGAAWGRARGATRARRQESNQPAPKLPTAPNLPTSCPSFGSVTGPDNVDGQRGSLCRSS